MSSARPDDSLLQHPALIGSLAVAGALLLGGAPVHAPAFGEPQAGTTVLERPAEPSAAATSVHTWMLHFDGALDAITLAAHRDLLRAISADARVLVVVPHRVHEGLFLDLVDPAPDVRRRLRFAIAPAGMSIWARDRYVVTERHGVRTVVLPDARSVRPDRRGDMEFARKVLGREGRARVLPTQLAFEGGDLLIGREVALVGAGTIDDNRARWRGDLDAVVAEFEHVLERRVIVLGEDAPQRPHDHADMYVHLLDERTVLVGDPMLTVQLWEQLQASPVDRQQLGVLGWPSEDAQREAARLYEPIVAQLREEGFTVLRVPALHTDVLFSWTNAVTEMRAGRRHAYVPSYGVPLLDAAAHRAWADAGCTVHPIAARAAVLEGGAVRCLTNTLRRPAAPVVPAADGARGVLR